MLSAKQPKRSQQHTLRAVAVASGICLLLCFTPSFAEEAAAKPSAQAERARVLFAPDNLVAWCIVPFDAKKRGPEERAEMLQRLGFKKFAYDYRAEHIPTFDAEMEALKKRKIELAAWWFPTDLNDEARDILAVLKKHGVKTQLWVTGSGGPTKNAAEQRERVVAEAARIRRIAEEAAKIGCTVGLYNHGGWFGEPENQLAIIDELKLPNVGIVYNQHHGHDHLGRFPELLKRMLPHLYVLNLNGMMPDGERRGQKILPLGQGSLDLELLKTICDSGYRGPIGILGHTQDDAEERLRDNLDGLAWLAKQVSGKPAGDRPKPRTPVPPATADGTRSAPATLETPGWLIAGRKEYREPPLTVECRARLTQRAGYNILVASDTKQSGRHWEVFSMAGSGLLTAYLPGYEPDHVTSSALVADGQWHEVSMQFEAKRVRLFLDGREVADQEVKNRGTPAADGGLAIGRLVEGGIGSEGDFSWVRITSGIENPRKPSDDPPPATDRTLGYWKFKDATPEVPDDAKAKNPAKRVAMREVPTNGHAGDDPLEHQVGHFQQIPDYSPKLVAELLADAKQNGNARRGIEVFRAAKFACLNCHVVGKHGGAVGPALTDAGNRLKPEEIAESVLWPKRQVKPEYVTWRVVLSDGRSLQGYKKRETAKALDLFDPATQQLHTLDKADIDETREVGTLMPDGLAAAMTESQRRDVLRLLLDLGHASGLEHEVRPGESPAEFAYDRAPLHPADWSLWQHPVNRDRLYDFYLKEALHFRGQSHGPHLLPAFPGLDGGKLGHWGNQNEETWKSDRWNETDLDGLLCGVFHGPDGVVPKGVCVRIAERGRMAVCFNPETLSYEALWQYQFLKFSSVRHGFLDGLRPAGKMLPKPVGKMPEGPFVYHGFYRRGSRVAFSYRVGEVEMLNSPWGESGKFEPEVAPASKHSFRVEDAKLWKGSLRWPHELKTKGKLGTGIPYAVDTIELPFDNLRKDLFYVGDHDFLPDGSVLLCTMQGDVWRVSGLDDKLEDVRFRRFASGLHQPLGMVVSQGQIYVLGRDQITRLVDMNDDGEADFYECFSNKFVTSPAGHDFICGLARDSKGRFYTASGKQGLIRISADGQQVDVLATGLRNPDGIALCADGSVTAPCSEGDWTCASMICLAKPEEFAKGPLHFGYGGPLGGKPPSLPLVYLPRGLDNSSGGQVIVPDDRWGPLAGQLVHFSFGQGSHFLLLRDEVQGQPQGAIVPLVGEFRSGAHRGKFNPKDGQLYVSGMAGWGSYTPDVGCFHRVRYTGGPVQLPKSFHVHENGVQVSFTRPVDVKKVAEPGGHFAQVWNYRYGPGYGSPELAPSHPGVVGHEALDIAGVHVIDPTTLFVELPDLQPVNQLHLVLQVDGGRAQELFITVHRLDKPFNSLPGYVARPKVIAAHPQSVDLALLGKSLPNPWGGKRPSQTTLALAAGKNLSFSTRTLRAKAGESLKLTFDNPDVVPHNWVLVRPDSLARVGALANLLVADPEAVLRQYVPKSADVLVYTDIVPAGEQFSIYFQAPQEKGRYPYLCTFPGHWMVMNGELIVE